MDVLLLLTKCYVAYSLCNARTPYIGPLFYYFFFRKVDRTPLTFLKNMLKRNRYIEILQLVILNIKAPSVKYVKLYKKHVTLFRYAHRCTDAPENRRVSNNSDLHGLLHSCNRSRTSLKIRYTLTTCCFYDFCLRLNLI